VLRKINFWIGSLAVASLVSFGLSTADAQTTRSTTQKRSAASSTTVRKKAATRSTVSSKQRSAIARAVATAREMADTVTPRYKVDASGDLVPDLRAAAAIIYNPETNQVLWEENSQDQRSIASITKVMTATVFLENNPDLTQPVTVARSDVFQASTTKLR
jgi:D-alanyl-D-alanine carboxypeptidase